MKQSILHKSASRGIADHGWLHSRHTFSFAHYFDPQRMNFGALRVLNDDTVAAGMGFGEHPHRNMEIISIPLKGELRHQDSMGTTAIIRKGEIQVMSAGSGITHSEYNHQSNQEVQFFRFGLYLINKMLHLATIRSPFENLKRKMIFFKFYLLILRIKECGFIKKHGFIWVS